MGGWPSITPVKPPTRKLTRNPKANSMGESSRTDPRNMVPVQLKNLIPVGTEMSKVRMAKKGSSTAPVVYVVRPHAHGQAADGERREHHALVAEHGLAREGRDDLGGDPEERQGQYVHLGVAEEPEQVLVEDRLATVGGVVEVGAKVAVAPQQHQ